MVAEDNAGAKSQTLSSPACAGLDCQGDFEKMSAIPDEKPEEQRARGGRDRGSGRRSSHVRRPLWGVHPN